MRKIRKVLAVIIAMAMVMGLSLTAFANDGGAGTGKAEKPTKADRAKATVKNVEAGAAVIAYQIVKADYNAYGFIGYSLANGQLTGLIKDPVKPTSTEVVTIAKSDVLNGLPRQEMTGGIGGDYTADLAPGYWIVLVRGTVKVYNPMLVGVYYSKSGSDNTMTSDPVDASGKWTLETKNAYAKSSEVPFEKTAAEETQNRGGDVHYTIKTTVPDYSDEYDKVEFTVKDTLDGLELKDGNIKIVSVDEMETAMDIAEENYSITGNEKGSAAFTISFNSDWIKRNGGTKIQITYTAVVTGDAVNETAHENDAELTYTNNPDGSTNKIKDDEKVYTFDIDGEVTADVLKKVQPGEAEEKTKALAGAEFTLYTDEACTNQYTNSKHLNGQPTATSDEEGKIYITGLAAGTYYLKETKAPEGFSLNDTIYKIEIDAEIEEDELKSWDIHVTDTAAGTTAENGFTVNNGTAKAEGNNEETDIMNTKLSFLPGTGGIGTTIFTVGGCALMILAAGLYFTSRRRAQK